MSPAGARPSALSTPDELSAVFRTAGIATLFLHDPWCPISREAEEEMLGLGEQYHLIDVSRGRELSKMVQLTTGIRHESPQVIVLVNGQPVWNASHLAIKREAVEEAIGSAAGSA